MVAILAERYGVPLEEVAEMFCSSHMGIGEIIQFLEGRLAANGGQGDNPGNLPPGGGFGWGLFRQNFWRVGLNGFHPWAASS
jgi:hypothetical protein